MSVVLTNAKQKFAESRENCPGLSETAYVISDYISRIVNDECNPEELCWLIINMENNLKHGRNECEGVQFPDYFQTNKELILNHNEDFLKIVENVSDEQFAGWFKGNFLAHKRDEKMIEFMKSNIHIDPNAYAEYPENVRAAAEWFANRLFSLYGSDGKNVNENNVPNGIFEFMRFKDEEGKFLDCWNMMNREITREELLDLIREKIQYFKESIAKDVLTVLQTNGYCALFTKKDYWNDEESNSKILDNALNNSNLSMRFLSPGTTMKIYHDKVEVIIPKNYGDFYYEIIWSNELKQNMDDELENAKMHK